MSARKKLIKYLREEVKKPVTLDEICSKFNIDKKQRTDFKDLLNKMVKEVLIYKNSSGKYGIPEKFNLIGGRIERNPKGFSFLIPDEPDREDVFIGMENMDGAMHNDKVFVRLLPQRKGKKQEGEVIKIIERANETVVGTFDKNKHFGFVIPDNKRIFHDVFIPREKTKGARQDQKVVVKINNWPAKKRNPEGEIIEILGDKGEPGVDIEAIIRQLELPGKFPRKVIAESKKISETIDKKEIENRVDLRKLPVVTIDGEDAKDFDDAVSIEKIEENTVRLGVHIADVSHYVKKGSQLDKEARKRGTSIYLVDRVIPMLPERLSNGICSLKPGVDRLTLSVFMEFKLDPLELMDYEIKETVINSNYRMTYQQVKEIIENENTELKNKYKDFIEQLEMMDKLREKLRKDRFASGSIDFDFPEAKVILDEKGIPVSLEKRTHGKAEQLIEEFMIAANNIVAEDMYWREIPFIYRVHDQPDVESMIEFNEFVHNFGYYIKGIRNSIHPLTLQEILSDIKGKPEERIISTVLLKSMKKAVYTDINIGHFGLALDYYSHFTSPIRRYPDLMIHRIIKEVISKGHLSEKRNEELDNSLPQIADHCSLQERRAMDAERDSVDLKKIEFMKDKVGQEFTGIISGVTNFGLFVELDNTVEGLIHVENLKDDYYHFMESQQALVGERTRNIYKLGDQVDVVVDKVNLQERQLDFVLVD